ncbi:MAG: recombination mediator RecR [Candidatus Margulisbacteria bacterium]|jgi:recombination protein RecR|nr:recombination mediator RecR [Candidatus Margulisiibacteriota bacterium]
MGPLDELSGYFQKMPSIGARSAKRLAFFILSQPQNWVDGFMHSLQDVKKNVRYCSQCHNITLTDPCAICRDPGRDRTLLCVVADPRDQQAIEKIGYRGLYHILGGLISPLDSITPEILKIDDLAQKIKKQKFQEVFFAINPTVEGEATILYIADLLQDCAVKMTRIAYGLPTGANIDYADELTVSRAYEGRVVIN